MDNPGYDSLVVGDDGGRPASGLIRRRIAEEGDGGSGRVFLDLSLGSIYNSPSADGGGGFTPVARTLLPAAAAPFVIAPPALVSRTAPFALGGASAVPGDWNGGGHVLVRDSKALLVVANPVSLLPPLFASSGSGAVPVPVNGNATAASDSGATPASRSKGAVALLGASPPSSAPPPPNRKAPRGSRGNATGRRRRSGAAGDDADAGDGDAEATNGGESTPPFPWATKTAVAHPTLTELIERGIVSVDGEVRCKRCDAVKTTSYEIRAKFEELSAFIMRNVEAMHDRAPPEWMYPVLPDCDKCGQKNSLRPVIAAEKWGINWMFLLLGQTLGLCTLEQLKHFCARTRQHRTGAKDRVLYSTYMELCNQLCPGGPFDMASERKKRTRPFA